MVVVVRFSQWRHIVPKILQERLRVEAWEFKSVIHLIIVARLCCAYFCEAKSRPPQGIGMFQYILRLCHGELLQGDPMTPVSLNYPVDNLALCALSTWKIFLIKLNDFFERLSSGVRSVGVLIIFFSCIQVWPTGLDVLFLTPFYRQREQRGPRQSGEGLCDFWIAFC